MERRDKAVSTMASPPWHRAPWHRAPWHRTPWHRASGSPSQGPQMYTLCPKRNPRTVLGSGFGLAGANNLCHGFVGQAGFQPVKALKDRLF